MVNIECKYVFKQIKLSLRMALRLGGCSKLMTEYLKDCVKLNIKDDVGNYQGIYPESLIDIRHDLAEKELLEDLKDIDGS